MSEKHEFQAVDQTKRRTWDLEEYRRRAEQRELAEIEDIKNLHRPEPPVKRAPLKARTKPIDLESNLGKTTVISGNTPLHQQGGFYCSICECVVKDSANFLDHVNGKKHQRMLGMSMRVERSTLEQVRARLQAHKRKMEEAKELNIEERLKKLKEDEEEKKRLKKEKKKEAKRKKAEEEEKAKTESVDPALATVGLPLEFGSTKTNK
jgi:U4/U6.U5 tri-snRNP component SNU23